MYRRPRQYDHQDERPRSAQARKLSALPPKGRQASRPPWGADAGAELGQWLARTIRTEQFPKGKASLNAAARVWSANGPCTASQLQL
jgi:hypothetical protein